MGSGMKALRQCPTLEVVLEAVVLEAAIVEVILEVDTPDVVILKVVPEVVLLETVPEVVLEADILESALEADILGPLRAHGARSTRQLQRRGQCQRGCTMSRAGGSARGSHLPILWSGYPILPSSDQPLINTVVRTNAARAGSSEVPEVSHTRYFSASPPLINCSICLNGSMSVLDLKAQLKLLLYH